MADTATILSLLLRMRELARDAGRSDIAASIDATAEEFDRDAQSGAREIMRLHNDPKSLNDIVLEKGGSPVVEENDEFVTLRSKVLELCRAMREETSASGEGSQ
jgi:hypothetical protein